MTTQLPIPKERLEQILAHCKREAPENMAPISAGSAVEVIGALLAAHEQEPVAWMWDIYGGHMYAKKQTAAYASTAPIRPPRASPCGAG